MVSLLRLLERQLADWQRLLSELMAGGAPAKEVAYCRKQIERLQNELTTLNN